MKTKVIYLAAMLACLAMAAGHAGERLLTVRDTIGVQQFTDPVPDRTARVSRFSPDGKYFSVVTQRGLLEQDRIEATLWLFDVAAEREFLRQPAQSESEPPRPAVLAVRTGTTDFYEQPSDTLAITGVHWSDDSRSVYFLGRNGGSEWHLYQVDAATHLQTQLTPDGQNVTAYSIAGETVLYAVSMPFQAAPLPREVVGVGVGLTALLSPDWQLSYPNQDQLWVRSGDTVHPVIARDSGRPVRLNKHFDIDSMILAPSPDGRFAVVTQAVDSIPASWAEYEPGATVGRISATGSTALAHAGAYEVPERFVLVDLRTGDTKVMIGGPLGRALNWWSGTQVTWSTDSQRVLLSDVFLPPEDVAGPERARRLSAPVIALYDVRSHSAITVASFKHSRVTDPKRWQVADVLWDEAARTVMLRYSAGGPAPETHPAPAATGKRRTPAVRPEQQPPPLEVTIKQGLNSAPTVYAAPADGAAARPIWDPNSQLAEFALGSAEIYDWQDSAGRPIKGVLIKPPHFDPARRYPLVIEARAYTQDRFVLDGTYATAAAARVMAADDLLVLQAGEPASPEQDIFNGATARALGGYRSVIAQLAAAGRIDPDRVAIMGFSRTCDTVMYAITHDPRLFATATIANGLTYGPLQYLSAVDGSPVVNLALQQWDLHYQGKPLGAGLSHFLQDNAIFNVAAVATPVRVETRSGRIPQLLTTDWESYAALRSLDKPVDLIQLPYATHVVSMPSDILASQQGQVDWVRFWLQGYEDPALAKAEQYRRWERLCDLQASQQPLRPRACVPARH